MNKETVYTVKDFHYKKWNKIYTNFYSLSRSVTEDRSLVKNKQTRKSECLSEDSQRITLLTKLKSPWQLCCPIFFTVLACAAAAAKSLQSCLTLCNPIDGSPPGSPVPGILQARTLEWVAISFSSAWKLKVKGMTLYARQQKRHRCV